MINYLLAEDYLILTDGKYPTVRLSASAVPVLKGQKRLSMKINVPVPVQDTEENNELFEMLRKLRKKIADEENVPPFVVFADAALKEMSRYFPVSKDMMLNIKGVGQMKFEKYGKTLSRLLENLPKNTIFPLSLQQKRRQNKRNL